MDTTPEHHPEQIDQVNREIGLYKTLTPTSCSHILRYRGNGKRICKGRQIVGFGARDYHSDYLYIQYARSGDAYSLIKQHSLDPDSRPYPEHFIWYFLKCIVDAMLTLQDGVCQEPLEVQSLGNLPDAHPQSSEETPKDKWRAILHHDIKDENIFLGDQDPLYPTYKRPLLGDFDCTYYLDEPPPRHYGTRDYLSPVSREYSPAITC